MSVLVDGEHDAYSEVIAESTLAVPSGFLRVTDAQGTWHIDVPCKRPRITLYAHPYDEGFLHVVVDRHRQLKRPERVVEPPRVDLDNDPLYRPRERSACEERVSAGGSWQTIEGIVRRWRRPDRVLAANRELGERQAAFPTHTIRRYGNRAEVTMRSSASVSFGVNVKGDKHREPKPSRKPVESVSSLRVTGEPWHYEGDETLLALLALERLVEQLELDDVGTEVVAGRMCDVIDGVPRRERPRADVSLAMEGGGGMHYRIWVDAERLVVLKGATLVDGKPAETVEFVDVVYDGQR
jgi:hypothetical protein